jgi:uncharacterized protein (DUF433 family)
MFINDQKRIDGTRSSVWDVYQYWRAGDWTRAQIAEAMGHTVEQIQVALDYIAANPEYVEKVHQEIELRNWNGMSAESKALANATPEKMEEWYVKVRARMKAKLEARNAASNPGGSQLGGTPAGVPQPGVDVRGLDRVLEAAGDARRDL